MSTPIYRLLRANDFDSYKSIRLECLKTYPDNFGPTYEEEASTSQLKLAHVFEGKEASDFIYGAFVDNKLVGICAFIAETMRKTKHRGMITQMYVSPAFGGKGIGTKLLESVIEHAFSGNIIELITLTVVSTNESAVAVYKKIGFVQYGILEMCFKNESGYAADRFMSLTKEAYFKGAS